MIVEMSSELVVTPTGWLPMGRMTGVDQEASFPFRVWLISTTRLLPDVWVQVAQSVPVESLAMTSVSLRKPLRMTAGNPLSRL